MRWSLANRLAKPSASIRSPAAIRSGHVTDWPQIWKPIRIGRAGCRTGAEQACAAKGGRHSVSRRRNLRLPLSRSEPSAKTDSVPTRMSVASALTSGVTPNLIWVR